MPRKASNNSQKVVSLSKMEKIYQMYTIPLNSYEYGTEAYNFT